MPERTAEPRHQLGGLAVALAKLNLDALTVADAVADVANTAGENVTTALRADLKEFKAETDTRFAEVNARFTEVRADIKELAGSIQSLHREVATLRWMIRDRLHPAEYLPRSLNVPPRLGLCSAEGGVR